ncbi:MAG: TrkA family potassium uptake protein [Clostridia bacterium]|nr:TrkA family potassium uptake protein [Clostridia bacterium]
MKSILLIGLGVFGMHIARHLNQLDHEVMAVDIDENKVNAALGVVTNAQIGDSTDPDFLKSLGIKDFDACMVTIAEDFQSSLETTSLLKEFGAKLVISRAINPIHAKFLLKNGADHVVDPEEQMASWMAIRYTSDHVIDYMELDGDNGVFELIVPENWIGKSVAQVDVRNRFNVNILGFRKNGKLDLTVTPGSVFDAETPILVLGSLKNVRKCFKI